MAGSAKLIIKQQDRSAIVPSLGGIDIGTVVNSKWGPITPLLNTTPTDLSNNYWTPDNKKGSSWNGAELLLANSNKVWITRAIHADAKHSAALVRFKITQTDFNTYPAPGTVPDTIVHGISGIGLTEVNSYVFPQYITNRVYEDTTNTVFIKSVSSTQVEVTGFTSTPSGHVLGSGDLVSFGNTPNDSSAFYSVVSALTVTKTEHILNVSGPITTLAGVEVKKMVLGTPTSYAPQVFVLYDTTGSTAITVDGHDSITNGDTITFDNGTTTVTASSKTLINRGANILTLGSAVTIAAGSKVQWMVSSEFEDRDAFLAIAKYPGDVGNLIKVGIRASVNYTNAFWVDVYVKGVLEESFEVTRDTFLDGFGNQMQIETKINGVSNWITVKDNAADLTRSVPLATSYGVWQRNSSDIFSATVISTVEDVVAGDSLIAVTNSSTLALSTRIKFSSTGPEYKILSKNDTTNVLTLDRQILETLIPLGTPVYKFDATVNNHPSGVYNGTQVYKFTLIQPQSGYSIGGSYTVSNVAGVVLDAGYNNTANGFDGSAITLFDVIDAFQKMGNKEKYKISLFCDNGFAYPEVAIALDGLCKGTNLSHAYNSVPYTSELQSDPVTAIVSYRNSTNLNSEFSSIFSGWIKVTDVYNQTKVWVAPSVFGVNTQSFVTRNYYMFTPAAGWVYGRLNGLEITTKYTEGQRDELINAQINPIRYREGWGMAVWGNETTYVKPSPLQLRSVAMLLIVLKYGLENYLEFKLFGNNSEATWTEIESALSIFIRDELYTPGGLYAYQVSVKKVITGTDIDNRRCPVFVGIQPTMDIKEIPVTLGIFNKSVSITI